MNLASCVQVRGQLSTFREKLQLRATTIKIVRCVLKATSVNKILIIRISSDPNLQIVWINRVICENKARAQNKETLHLWFWVWWLVTDPPGSAFLLNSTIIKLLQSVFRESIYGKDEGSLVFLPATWLFSPTHTLIFFLLWQDLSHKVAKRPHLIYTATCCGKKL